MCNKHSKIITEVLEQNKVYIIKYIIKSLNEFVLISTMHTSYSEIVFSVIALNISLYI